MHLLDIVNRSPVPEPWTEGEKIPWDDPDFSRRMLAQHLSQQHDLASRRTARIDAHVDWISRVVLKGRIARVLDLGCGPGLYTTRLAMRGCSCVGIDFSPVSVDYARAIAAADRLDCTYHLADLRTATYGAGFGLVMMIFGELNVFRPAEARAMLLRARESLNPGGQMLLEVHTFEAVRAVGARAASWAAAGRGLFSDRPHIRLDESFWDPERRVATERYYILDATTGAVARYAQSMQAYTDDEYRDLLSDSGFLLVDRYPSLSGATEDEDFSVLLAEAG